MASTPTERKLAAQIAAHESWANTVDRAARTANGTAALKARFEKLADPEGNLSPTDRAQRAEHLYKAHFARLGLASAKARRARREAKLRGAP